MLSILLLVGALSDFSGSATVTTPGPNGGGYVQAATGAGRFQRWQDADGVHHICVTVYAPDSPPPDGFDMEAMTIPVITATGDGVFVVAMPGFGWVTVIPGEADVRELLRARPARAKDGHVRLHAGGEGVEAGKVWILEVDQP